MSRVCSQNLFNFPATGLVDPDIAAFEAQMMEMMDSPEARAMMERLQELMLKDDPASNTEFVALLRGMRVPMMQQMGQHPTLQAAGEEVNATLIKVPTTHDGDFDVPVLVQTPKKLEGKGGNAAYIYAHGGGAVVSSAQDSKGWFDHVAVTCDVVVFNVDYRLAPETKCPNNVKDFYESVKYICANAATLGLDPSKIAIAGDSGGGYICLGTMVLLAQNDEAGLVKLAMPGIPMIADLCFSDMAAMTVEEREIAHEMRKIWQLVAADFEAQKSDPLLFPGKVSDDVLGKFPPTVVFECEFDIFITEATRLAARLRRAGRLLEFVVIPGAKHCSYFMTPEFECSKKWQNTLKVVLQEYLHK